MNKKTNPDSTQAVEEFLATLDHPCKAEIEALRQIFLGADPRIAEGIKWKVPSFRTSEYFATLHLRTKIGVGVILHLGAKVRDVPDFSIEDPSGLLQWLAKDRAMVVFRDLEHLESQRVAFESVLRAWIEHV